MADSARGSAGGRKSAVGVLAIENRNTLAGAVLDQIPDHPGDMSQDEHPERLAPDHEPTVEDVRELMGASTPHFALQLRARIRALIRGLPEDHPARIEGEREIARLEAIAFDGETRGHAETDGLASLPSSAPRRRTSAPLHR